MSIASAPISLGTRKGTGAISGAGTKGEQQTETERQGTSGTQGSLSAQYKEPKPEAGDSKQKTENIGRNSRA